MNMNPSDLQAFLAPFYQGAKLLLTPFAYPVTFAALAQNGVATTNINIAANADFVLMAIRHHAQIGAAQTISTKTSPFVRMLVTDSGTNEQYTNGAIDLSNYSSDGYYDHQLPYPRIISGRSALTVQVTNYAPTAETYTTLDISFEGVLVRIQGN